MNDKIILNHADCNKKCHNVNYSQRHNMELSPYSIFGNCDFEGTIYLKTLIEKSDNITVTLEIDISEVDFSLDVKNKTVKKTMEFTIESASGYKFEGNFSMAFEYQMVLPFVEGKFSYKLSMPFHEISKLNYNIETECMFANVNRVGPQQCNKGVYFENMNAADLKSHRGQISVEFKLDNQPL